MKTGPKVTTPPQAISYDECREIPMPCWLTAYLAGPMRGYDHDNFPAFFDAASALRKTGIDVRSPAEHDLDLGYDPWDPSTKDSITLEECMQWDLAQVAQCDAVILLPGWEKSEGVGRELQVALWCGKDVYTYGYDSLRRRAVLTPCPEMNTFSTPRQFIENGEGAAVGYATPLADPDFHYVGDIMDPRDTQITVTLEEYGDVKITPGILGEKRITDPKTGGMKGSKVARMDLVPWDAILDLSIHFGENSETHGGKYPDRNWEKGYDWSLGIASLGRHLAAWASGEEFDEEGHPHIRAIHWHASTLHAFALRGAGTDNRNKVGINHG